MAARSGAWKNMNFWVAALYFLQFKRFSMSRILMENGAPKGFQNQYKLNTLGPSGQNFEIWVRFENRLHDVIILVPFFNCFYKNIKKTLTDCFCSIFVSPGRELWLTPGVGTGGQQITKHLSQTICFLYFSPQKGALTDAGDGDGEAFFLWRAI